MKNLILTLVLALSSLTAQARDAQPSKYDVLPPSPRQGDQGLVLISEQMTTEIDAINKSNLAVNLKIKIIKLLVKELGATKKNYDRDEDEPSLFCKTAGETYKTENKNAVKMAEQCSDRLADGAMLDEVVDDYSNLQELRLKYSEFLRFAIAF